ncbi:type II toxin-antitoxin system PemK/MazF family toxin [Peptoniphilus faecalis]|nr:type II toxin-antitoxin system PemK/MazF family toxin [Peptoniphilus faecalis]
MRNEKLNEIRVMRGDVVMVDLGERFGCEQDGIRPAVVIQNDVGNYCGTTTIVAPLTAGKKNNVNLPVHTVGIQLKRDSIALLEQIIAIDKRRVICILDHLSDELMQDINEKIKVSLAV